MKIRPLHDWVLIEVEPPAKKKGSIILPDPDTTPVRFGKVLRYGPGRRLKKSDRLIPAQVKKGERVAFFMATTQTRQGRSLSHSLPDNQALIKESDVLGVLDGNVMVEA
jgi:co-chaperonin GroES (HSP10)